MKKLLLLSILILISFVVIAGCDQVLPSWDTNLQVPLVRFGEEDEIKFSKLLGDEFEPGSDGVMNYSQKEEQEIDIGSELQEVGITQDSNQSLVLPPIYSGLNIGESNNVDIPPGADENNDFSKSIDITDLSGFDDITFSDNVDNQLVFTIEEPDKFSINNLNVQVEIGDSYDENKDIDDNNQAKFSLKNESINSNEGFTITLSELDTSSGDSNEDVPVDVVIDNPEIRTVTGLEVDQANLGSIEEEFAFDGSLDFDIFDGLSISALTAGTGSELGMDLGLPADNNFDLDISEISLGNNDFTAVNSVEGEDFSYYIDLVGKEIADLDSLDNIGYVLEIANDSGTIDYNADSGTLDFDFVLPALEDVKIDTGGGFLDVADLMPDTEELSWEYTDLELPEEVEKIGDQITFDQFDLYFEIVDLLDEETGGEDGFFVRNNMGFDFDLTMEDPQDSENNPVSVTKSFEPDEQKRIQFGAEVLDFISRRPEQINIALGQTGFPADVITLDQNDNLKAIFAADMGLEITLNQDIEEYIYQPVDPLDQETVDMIKNGVSTMRLNLDDFDNKLGFNTTLELYLASNLEDPGNDTENSELFEEENMVDDLSIGPDTDTAEFDLEVDNSEADKLIENNTYFGIKLVISGDDEEKIKISEDDYISPGDVSAGLTVKVNR